MHYGDYIFQCMAEVCNNNPPMNLCNNKKCGMKHPKNPNKLICRNCLFKAQNESDMEDSDEEKFAIEEQ